jgi:hypothetical protein
LRNEQCPIRSSRTRYAAQPAACPLARVLMRVKPAREALDDLCCQILLEAEWLLLIREDPRLP